MSMRVGQKSRSQRLKEWGARERAVYEAQTREDAQARAEGREPRLIQSVEDIEPWTDADERLVGTVLKSLREERDARIAEVRRGEVYEALAAMCEDHGANDVLFCLSVLLRDRAEATGSERYEAAAEDVARAYERRVGGELDPKSENERKKGGV